ncbi:uncharacterized protein [Triticum aestivum]|uniref:uncharacterized protein n=1 Tax=Triticum aestivum TaxID=4565 RepID=UPI001D02D5EA|nr:uncharacterized protein LOC123153367 [Triticum aestivum]
MSLLPVEVLEGRETEIGPVARVPRERPAKSLHQIATAPNRSSPNRTLIHTVLSHTNAAAPAPVLVRLRSPPPTTTPIGVDGARCVEVDVASFHSHARSNPRLPPFDTTDGVSRWIRRCRPPLPHQTPRRSPSLLHWPASVAMTSARGTVAAWLLRCLRVVAPPPCCRAPILRSPPRLGADEDRRDPRHCFLHPAARAVPALHYAGTPRCSDPSWWKPDTGFPTEVDGGFEDLQAAEDLGDSEDL